MRNYKLRFINKIRHYEGDVVPTHTHMCGELVLYSGNGETTIDGALHSFSKNSIAVINMGSPHSETHFKSGSVIYFSTDIADDKGNPLIPDGVYSCSSPEVVYAIEQIYTEACHQRLGYEDFISAKICEFMILLSREKGETLPKRKNLNYCMNYIIENCYSKIDISALAESCGCGYEYFRHLFKTPSHT